MILQIRNESGEWVTIPAIQGAKPVKGVDYFTEEDKTEIVNAVIAALPNAEEVSY
jgi:hypothetical protein